MLRKLAILFKKRPPEGKWFPYEDWRGRGWNELEQYKIIDYDRPRGLIKVKHI